MSFRPLLLIVLGVVFASPALLPANAPSTESSEARKLSQQGRALLQTGRLLQRQAELPAETENQTQLQRAAREKIQQARGIFQKAHDLHKQAWEKFESYIPPENVERIKSRDATEGGFIRSQKDLADCTYEEAQTHPRGSQKFISLLTKASNEFAAIQKKYRIKIGGMQAHMWQGKCFEEQGEIGKALGIYNQLIQHQDQSPNMLILKNQAQQFRLICLNHDKRKEHLLVAHEANTWLKENKTLIRQPVGLGIRRELAVAYEKQAALPELDDKQRKKLLLQALDEARELNQSPGAYKDESRHMVARLLTSLGRDQEAPQDFDTAYGIARDLTNEIKPLRKKIAESANEAERSQLQVELDRHLRETEEMLKLALELVDDQAIPADVNQARYFLAYVYYLKGWSYDAAILSEFVAGHGKEADSETALDAAFLALAAYLQVFDTLPKEARGLEMERILRIGRRITTAWPESPRAAEARIFLASAYEKQGELLEAARWYLEVPEAAAQYPSAQISAGRAFLNADARAESLSEADKPAAEEREQWREEGTKRLQNGIEILLDRNMIADAQRNEIIAAKATLAQILITKGRYHDAIEMLVGSPHVVMSAITVDDEQNRPETGVKSRAFASGCYRLLLRCYVGTQQIDEALIAMDDLERVSGSDASVTSGIYRQLGEEIEKEIERLVDANEVDRLRDVRASFDHFLNELYARRDQMTFNSLHWVAEAYTGLGVGVERSAPDDARVYFERAALTYQEIIQRDDVPPGREIPIKMRLVGSRVRQGDYEIAAAMIAEIIAQKPKLLDAQFEAAKLYEDWGGSENGKHVDKLLVAMNGNEDEQQGGSIWGWGKIAVQLLHSLNARQLAGEKQEEYRDRYFDARFHLSSSRRSYGLLQSNRDRGEKSLAAARRELEGFSRLTHGIPDSWKDKFNQLYRDLLSDLGDPPAELTWATIREVAEKQPGKRDRQAAGSKQADQSLTQANKPESQTSRQPGMGRIILVLLVAVGASIGLVVLFIRNSRRPQRKTYGTTRLPSAKRRRQTPQGERAAGSGTGRKRPAQNSGHAPESGTPTRNPTSRRRRTPKGGQPE